MRPEATRLDADSGLAQAATFTSFRRWPESRFAEHRLDPGLRRDDGAGGKLVRGHRRDDGEQRKLLSRLRRDNGTVPPQIQRI